MLPGQPAEFVSTLTINTGAENSADNSVLPGPPA